MCGVLCCDASQFAQFRAGKMIFEIFGLTLLIFVILKFARQDPKLPPGNVISMISVKRTFDYCENPVRNVTWIFSCLFDGSLVESDIKSDGNPIIFLVNAMEIGKVMTCTCPKSMSYFSMVNK